MQVVLLENIAKLGKIGDLVEVKNGYARNFLLKKNKALRLEIALKKNLKKRKIFQKKKILKKINDT